MMATVQIPFSVLEKLSFCSCGCKLKAVYYCHDKTCKRHQTQYYFCESCCSEEGHDHRPQRIDIKCQKEQLDWTKLLAEVNKKASSSEHALKEMINLLDFFENAADQNNIYIDHPMKRRLDEIKEFAKLLAYVVNDQEGSISELINYFKVKELNEKVEERQNYENQLKLFGDLD